VIVVKLEGELVVGHLTSLLEDGGVVAPPASPVGQGLVMSQL